MPRPHRIALAAAALAAVALTAPALGAGASPAARAATAGWTQLQSGPEPDSNPLKGFIPFESGYSSSYSQFPYTMEWDYFPVSQVMTGSNTFDWSGVDQAIAQAKARGHQVAMRFYLDYPGSKSGVPQFLLDGGLQTHSYSDYGNGTSATPSVIPNYDDPNLLSAMDRFIAAFGAHLDGHPEIGFVQVGLIGFWGEWHTYPYNGTTQPQNYMPTSQDQQRILTDFTNAFTKTQLEVRLPNGLNKSLPMGYHDDSFALETEPYSDWHFMDAVNDNGVQNKWQTYSIGGELRPELQGCIFTTGGCEHNEPGGDYDFPGSVSQTHVSWLMDQYAFGTGYSSTDRPAAITAAKSMGYSFRASEALVPGQAATGSSANVGMTVSNVGIAPFYYPWPITLALVDGSGAITRPQTTSWHLSDIASGSSKQFTGTFDMTGVQPGSYTLVAQGTNPMAGGAPIRFANAGQDQAKAGWLSLGPISVTAATSYEAEASGNTLTGGAKTASCSGCSGGAKVGYVGNGATLVFNGVTGGTSSITVAYASAVARTATVQVDSGSPVSVSFPATADWNTVGTQQVSLAIPSGGTHTVAIANSSAWAPDIDRITVG